MQHENCAKCSKSVYQSVCPNATERLCLLANSAISNSLGSIFASLGLKEEDFLVPDQIIQLGYPPNRIDVISTLEGVDFETCCAARVEIVIDDVPVDFIDLENLKKNKRAAGRPQDLADLDQLGGV